MSAFDQPASSYDADFSRIGAARHLRARTHALLMRHVRPGDRVLELGCGTGEDARMLGERGIAVTATDASASMLAIARAKCAHLPHVTCAPLDLNALPDDASAFARPYALAFANFGVLNCVPDYGKLARWLAARLAPGGTACFAVMSRWCAWEIAWHGAHGDLHTALRRVRGRSTYQAGPDAPRIAITYPTPRALTAAFAPQFIRTAIAALGLVLPPSDLFAALDHRPALLNALARLDDAAAGWSTLAGYADHYWITFRRI